MTFDQIRLQVQTVAPARALPTAVLVGTVAEQEVRILAYLLKCRLSGFMVVLPDAEEAHAILDAAVDADGCNLAVSCNFQVNLEDCRSRKTLIGFLGMLHPAEFVHLVSADLLLPSDTMTSDPVFYVHIRHPKTARFTRKQHCKIDDASVLAFISTVFGHQILAKLGIPLSLRSNGATPAVLRCRASLASLFAPLSRLRQPCCIITLVTCQST